ncbi:MAG: sigma-70 family RNA polymerase sigma factor [Bacteroidetes bacterium]|nr:sigma-70 family RNA polymerase sigma factor [Bacteroidota bacterium]MBU1717525.1 sigma-70 family RNA polymerase sigma factor [Bacteroidota bacterium]
MDLMENSNLENLIRSCIKGDRKCQKAFFKMFYGKMLAVCLRYAKDTEEARDICQDGFIKVFANLENYEFSGSLEGWVRRIIVNTAIDAYRKRKDIFYEFNDNLEYEEDTTDHIEVMEEQMMNKLKVEVVIQLTQKLTPVYRTVLNLYVFENFSHKEIAEELNISVGTSKSNLSKAKRNLKKLFEDYLNGSRQAIAND